MNKEGKEGRELLKLVPYTPSGRAAINPKYMIFPAVECHYSNFKLQIIVMQLNVEKKKKNSNEITEMPTNSIIIIIMHKSLYHTHIQHNLSTNSSEFFSFFSIKKRKIEW